MRAVRVVILGCLLAAAFSAAFSAQAKNPQAVGIEPIGSTEWPAVAAQLAKNIANDSFAHNYARVWKYLLPSYQRAVSKARWTSCQHTHPVAPPSIRITKVLVAQASELPLDLPLLGHQNVQQIELIVGYTDHLTPTLRYAVVYAYWLEQGNVWRAVWPSQEFQALKAGNCYVAPAGGAALY
jgi:hypothetical protein